MDDDRTPRSTEHGHRRQPSHRGNVDESLPVVNGPRPKGHRQRQQQGRHQGRSVQRPTGQIVQDRYKQQPSAQTERCEHERREENGEQHHEQGVHEPTYMASMTMAMPWPPPMQAVATP